MDDNDGAPRWLGCGRCDEALAARLCLMASHRREADATAASRRGQVAVRTIAGGAGATIEPVERRTTETVETLDERLAGMDARLIEQERTIRQTLTMLIDWIESSGASDVPCLPQRWSGDD